MAGVDLWDWKAKGGSVRFIDDPNHASILSDSFYEGTSKVPTNRFKRDGNPEECDFVRPDNELLGQWRSTAISGNDITSSILYTGGLVINIAGRWAPLCLLLVSIVLYFFRKVYEEVVTALPLNGGTYSALVNSTKKSIACFAGTLSCISYVATVVISGATATVYLKDIWTEIDLDVATIVVYVLFFLLLLLGLKESSNVALSIFIFHMATLTLLVGVSIAYGFSTSWTYLISNFQYERQISMSSYRNTFMYIFLGYGQSFLGVSGFETSANYIQQQRKGVFKKTLRNIWGISSTFNVVLCILAFAVIPPTQMYDSQGSATQEIQSLVLSVMATNLQGYVGGKWLNTVVIIDAVTVLCGAVFTGYVGATGLILRMSEDDCLPRVFQRQLSCNHSNYAVSLFFCAVCITLYLITNGDVSTIGGVYTVAFISVMFLFASANMLNKHSRRQLRRDIWVPWYVVLFCMFASICALTANIIISPLILKYFTIYFALFLGLVMLSFGRTLILRSIIRILEDHAKERNVFRKISNWMVRQLHKIEKTPVVFYSRRLDLRDINKAVMYVLQNEFSRHLIIVHFHYHPIPESVLASIKTIDSIYPNIRVECIAIHGKFCPGAIRLTESITGVPCNRMMIASPSASMVYNIAELGGVRIIMSRHDKGLSRILVEKVLPQYEGNVHEMISELVHQI